GAKTQSQHRRFNFPAIQLCAFAPLREVKAGIDEPFQNGLIGISSFCLPVSLTPFHHPRAKLGWRNGDKTDKLEYFGAPLSSRHTARTDHKKRPMASGRCQSAGNARVRS
ncbi:MAG: hypothetical protein ACKOEO_10665, partial [Planctomycetaceae bacterium]